MIAPTLSGSRVTLRPQKSTDFDAYYAFRQSPRAQYTDLKPDRKSAWFAFVAESGAWSLYGMGAWTVDVDGAVAGQVGVMPYPHFPEIEIGWILYDGFEGRGIAFEAATLALGYTWETIKPSSLVSYIDPENARSRKLANALGAAIDPDAARPDGEGPEECVVYRHRRPT